ncbi:MAG: coq1 putative hexaprenyl diphosphate synthase [Vezdaea aestivalis]|nr:MAG: coq1 putative hexaprenyl diphosphate synthase [Vezdaea aestivalis]
MRNQSWSTARLVNKKCGSTVPQHNFRHSFSGSPNNSLSRPIYLQHRPRRRYQSSWAAAVSAVQSLASSGVQGGSSPPVSVDPLRIVAKEMQFFAKDMRELLGSGHPSLDTVAKYYAKAEGKHLRPLLVLLMSQATAIGPKQPRRNLPSTVKDSIDMAISPASVLSDVNPDRSSLPEKNPEVTNPFATSDTLPSQRRLAEITELIHTASLLHDDVIDSALTRRSSPSVNVEFGNKMAVLAGDFLLGRASVALARLRDPEVIELMATIIANLVEGEFMQLRNTATDETNPNWTEDTMPYYLQKTYLKSASLISKSCRSAALLGHSDPWMVEAAYAFGKNLGMAFQLVDDMLDYTVSSTELGKPAGADLKLGLATAPLLFAWKEHEELGALVGRKFGQAGDVDRARELVASSNGVEQTRALAQDYADKAVAAISNFPDSQAKHGLEEMCVKTMQRRK